MASPGSWLVSAGDCRHFRVPMNPSPTLLVHNRMRRSPLRVLRGLVQWLGAHTLFLSAMWCGLGLLLALLTPWLGLWPRWITSTISVVAPLVTVLLIVLNLLRALWRYAGTRRLGPTLPLTLVQFPLFTLLFFQLACYAGTDHYEWDSTPSWWEWGQFTLIHPLRAGDVLDIIEAYGLRLQQIRHNSVLVSTALIAFHLIVDLFLLAVLIDRFTLRTPGRLGRRMLTAAAVCVTVLWALTAWQSAWRESDIVL